MGTIVRSSLFCERYMPIYEYDCPTCGRFEVIQKFSDKALEACPHCKEKGKKSSVTKALSASAFHLKGSGWYKTDYASGSASGSSNNAAKKTSPDSSSESSRSESSSSPPASATPSDSSSESSSKKTPETKKGCGTGCGCH